MSLGENIKRRREELKLSQESVAERLGVNRQAVSKWETGQSKPTAGNLIQLAEVLETSLSDLAAPEGKVGDPAAPGEKRRRKTPNPILRANMTKWAIILQAGFLRSCAVFLRQFRENPEDQSRLGLFWFLLVLLLACSVWMTSNHRFEPDEDRRKRNVTIELLYCILQTMVALLNTYLGLGLVGAVIMIVIGAVYLLYVNPRFMGRKLTK